MRAPRSVPSIASSVADSRSPRDGRFIERLGYFNPLMPKDNADRLKFDIEKAKAWMAKGALPTDRVSRFLDEAGVLKRETRNNPRRPSRTRRRRSALPAAAAPPLPPRAPAAS